MFVPIEADGVQRELFFILESRKTGDLKLLFRRSLYSNPDNKNDPVAGKLINEQRFSLHTSPDSIHGINTFHQTYRVGEHVRNGYSFTKVIKSESGFAPLFSRRCPDLAKQHYVSGFKKNMIEVPLGRYDPTKFMLIYSVFVGPPKRQFRLYCDNDVCVAQHQFSQFTLVVLWNFLSLPSSDTGWKLHVEIPHPEVMAKHPELSGLDRPLLEADCVRHHLSKAAYLRHQFLCWIANSEGVEASNLPALLGQFFQYGLPNTTEYKDLMRRVIISTFFPVPSYPIEEETYSLEDGVFMYADLF
jgi:hypothetical protein